MIEIVVLIMTVQKIGKMMKAKGYEKAGKWQWMFVGGWIGGEILGAIIGTFIGGSGNQAQCVVYICALIGAVIVKEFFIKQKIVSISVNLTLIFITSAAVILYVYALLQPIFPFTGR